MDTHTHTHTHTLKCTCIYRSDELKDIIHSMRNRQKIRDIVKVQNGEKRRERERERERGRESER